MSKFKQQFTLTIYYVLSFLIKWQDRFQEIIYPYIKRTIQHSTYEHSNIFSLYLLYLNNYLMPFNIILFIRTKQLFFIYYIDSKFPYLKLHQQPKGLPLNLILRLKFTKEHLLIYYFSYILIKIMLIRLIYYFIRKFQQQWKY